MLVAEGERRDRQTDRQTQVGHDHYTAKQFLLCT